MICFAFQLSPERKKYLPFMGVQLLMSPKVKLTEEFEHFKKLRSLPERIRFCEDVIRSRGCDPVLKPEPYRIEKSDQLSAEHLKMAIDYKNEVLFRPAFDFVNAAICYAESDILLAECYAIRAHLYNDIHVNSKCLRNIEQAKRVPECSIHHDERLKDAESRCLRLKYEEEALKSFSIIPTQVRHIPQLSGPAHPNIASIDKRMYLDFDNRRNGPHLRTREGLGVGKIVAVDTVLNPALMKEARYGRCATCFSENLFDLEPCQSCCSAMFCADTDCKAIAMEGFHRYECRIIDFLYQNGEFRTVFRNVTNTFREQSDIKDFQQFANCYDYGLFNFWTMNWQNPPRNYQAKLAYTLETHEHERPLDEQFYLCRLTAYFFMVMKTRSPVIFVLFPDESTHDFLRDFCHRLSMVCVKHLRSQTNNSSVRFHQELQKQDSFALGLHPIISMITHDCKPNVAVIGHRFDKVIVYTTRPIKENGQLFLDYA